MKKLIVFVLVLGLCGAVQAALVSQWKFDGDLTDASGNGHHGSAAGGPLTYIAGGPYGANPGDEAAHFDGNARVNVGSNLLSQMPSSDQQIDLDRRQTDPKLTHSGKNCSKLKAHKDSAES